MKPICGWSIRRTRKSGTIAGIFFAAAAETMRRILVDRARRKAAAKRGGELARVEFDPELTAAPEVQEDLVALDEALDRLAVEHRVQAELVKLRYFGGLKLAKATQSCASRSRSCWPPISRAASFSTCRLPSKFRPKPPVAALSFSAAADC